MFDLGPFGRFQQRRKAHLALLSALSPTDPNYLTQTISVQNHLSTAFDTLALYLATGQTKSKSRSLKNFVKRARKARKSK